MLHFDGDKDFTPPPAEVWAKLRDARFLVQCVPGAEAVSAAERDRAVCTIRPKLAFMRGTLDVTLRVLEAAEPSAVRLGVQSKGVGSTSEVEVSLALAAAGGGTRAHWTADVKSLGGLLKAVPQGLLRGAAEKVIQDVLAQMAARLNDGQPPAPAGA
jgi:carbon monoxide dehydrogenase subunit G